MGCDGGGRCDTTVHLSHAATRFLGDLLYDIFVSLNILIKAVRRLFRLPYWSLAAHVHCKVRSSSRLLQVGGRLTSPSQRVLVDHKLWKWAETSSDV